MITMKNWYVSVPRDEQSIGYVGENEVYRLEIETDAPPEWVYRLDIKYIRDGKKNFLLLNYEDGILYCDILREYLQNGRLQAQVRALKDEQEKHSNIFELIVFNSIQALKEFETNDPSAFEQLEQRLNQLQQSAEQSANRAEDAADRAEAAGNEGGTTDHRQLTNRDAADQHPIEAVSHLREELNRIPQPVEPITNKELEELLK